MTEPEKKTETKRTVRDDVRDLEKATGLCVLPAMEEDGKFQVYRKAHGSLAPYSDPGSKREMLYWLCGWHALHTETATAQKQPGKERTPQ